MGHVSIFDIINKHFGQAEINRLIIAILSFLEVVVRLYHHHKKTIHFIVKKWQLR